MNDFQKRNEIEYAEAFEGDDDMPPGWLTALIVALAASVLIYASCCYAGVM